MASTLRKEEQEEENERQDKKANPFVTGSVNHPQACLLTHDYKKTHIVRPDWVFSNIVRTPSTSKKLNALCVAPGEDTGEVGDVERAALALALIATFAFVAAFAFALVQGGG